VNWLPAWAPNDSYRESFNNATTIWANFYADNCNPGQVFNAVFTTVYEYRNNAYPFGTSNLSTGAGLELTQKLHELHGTVIANDAELAQHRAGVLAAAREHVMGRKHAGGFLNWIKQSALPFLGRAAEQALPIIGGIGASLLSDGAISPAVGIGAGRAIMSGAERMFHPYAQLEGSRQALPIPSREPMRVEVLDDYEGDGAGPDSIYEPDASISLKASSPMTPTPSVPPAETSRPRKEGFEEKAKQEEVDIDGVPIPTCSCFKH
jgi:hypothetical protein